MMYQTKHDWHLIIKGYILYATIEIERKLEVFLSNHFCESEINKQELNELLFQNERVTFDFKRDIASTIINNHYAEFKKDKNTLLSDLSDIAPHRNGFAHLENLEGKVFEDIINGNEIILDPTNPSISIANRKSEYLIIFKRFKTGKPQYFGYDEMVISKIETLFNKTSETLDLLINTEASRISTHA